MNDTEQQIVNWLGKRVSEARFLHSLGVMDVVTQLAAVHDIDQDPLRQAALVHDCAREFTARELLAAAGEWGLPLRDVDRQSPVLLHGKLAVVIAERELGLSHPAMVSAVCWHTAGHPGMSLSDKLFFLADVLEPTRPMPWVPELGAVAREDVDRAVLMAIEINTDHLDRTGRVVDPDTYALKELLLQRLRG